MGNSKSILIVDDNPENLKVLSKILEKEDFRIRISKNGIEAIESVEAEIPSVILMDILMPGIDGYETSRRIKSIDKFDSIPILFISALAETFDKIKAFEAGGQDYITKPFQEEEVVARVRTHFKMYEYQQELENLNSDLYYQLQSSFEQASIGIVHTNQETKRLIKANKYICNFLGYTESELLEKTISELTHPDYDEGDKRDLQRLVSGKSKSFTKEKLYFLKDGTTAWAKVTVSYVNTLIDSIPNYFLAFIEDISDKKIIEENLRTTQLHYTDFINSSTDVVTYWRMPENLRIDYPVEQKLEMINEGVLADANKSAWELSGFQSKEQFVGTKLRDVLGDRSLDEKFTKFMNNNYHQENEEVHIVFPDGTNYYSLTNWYGSVEDGMLTSIWSVAKNITEQKKAEDELKIKNNAIDSSNNPMAITDMNGKMIYVNNACVELWGYSTKDEILGRDLPEFWHGDGLNNTLVELFESGSSRGEDTALRKDGTTFPVQYSTNIIKDKEGNPEKILGSFINISERKKAEEEILKLNRELEDRIQLRTQELQAEQEFTEALLNSLPGTLNVFDDKGRIHRWNKNLEIITGYSKVEVGKMSALDFAAEEYKAKTIEAIEETFKTGYGTVEIELRLKNGEKTPFYFHAKRFIRGKTKLLLAVGIDIRELKETQRALKESEEKFRELSELSPVAIYETDLKGNIRYLNRYGCELVELSENDLESGFSVRQLIAPEEHSKLQEDMANRYEGEASKPNEYTLVTNSGKRIPVIAYSRSIIKGGDPVGLRGVFLDISERKEAETEIKKLSRAVEENPVSVVITDKQGKIEYVNKVFAINTGYSFDEVKGKNPRILKSGEHPEAYFKKMWDTILAGKVWAGDFRNRKKDGSLFWEHAAISPIKDESGEITNFVAVKEDITYKKQIEKELVEAKHAAEAANSAKSEFLANMSHEIRTPMNAVLGFTNLLLKLDTDELQHGYLNSVKSSGTSLLTLIDDVLDLSKIEAGRLEIVPHRTDLYTLIDEIIPMFSLKVKELGLDFIVEIDQGVPRFVMIDEVRLRQILINLLSNAVKFTEKGHIGLNVSCGNKKLSESPGFYDLTIKVVDTGIGIAKPDQERIFESFSQQEGQSTKKYGGTGLGLTITRNLVELMNGTISVKSSLDKGSTFKVIIPQVEYLDEEESEDRRYLFDPDSIEFDGSEILMVDDIEDNRRFLSISLTDMNHHVSIASNGKEAVDILKNHSIDLIITDLKMPVMDGFELNRFVKASDQFLDIPVIVTTASVGTTGKEQIDKHGFSGFLMKPIQEEELIKMLAGFLPHKQKGQDEKIVQEMIIQSEIRLNPDETADFVEVMVELDLSHRDAEKMPSMKEVIKLAKNISSAGDKFQVDELTNLGKDLNAAIQTFDVEQIMIQLRRYPSIIEGIKQAIA